jgi:hypothetical protein
MAKCLPNGTTKSKFGFPKPISDHTTQDESGQIYFARADGAQRLIEYSPILMLMWDGHVHMQIL